MIMYPFNTFGGHNIWGYRIIGLSILAALQMERWFLYLPKSGKNIAIAGL